MDKLREYYGSHYDFVIKTVPIRTKALRDEFYDRYKNADRDRFTFSVTYKADGTLYDEVVYFKVPNDEDTSYNIKSNTFKGNKSWVWYLYRWSRLWSVTSSPTPDLSDLPLTTLPYDIANFRVFVSSDKGFDSGFPDLTTTRTTHGDDITKVRFDYENDPYFASIAATYISSYLCGVSVEHLTGRDGVVTSMARYHMYYNIRRFMRDPTKMTKYLTNMTLIML